MFYRVHFSGKGSPITRTKIQKGEFVLHTTLAIIDTRVGNIRSVLNAIHKVSSIQCQVVADTATLADANGIILPGVGAFGETLTDLQQRGLIEAIKTRVSAGVPLLGICLGMQLLAQSSEEHGYHQGLELIKGQVTRLQSANNERVPNIGWCRVAHQPNARLFANISTEESFYFAHSYALNAPESTVACIDYGQRKVTVAVESDHVFGVQFHPEKSQDAGLQLLANFTQLIEARA